MRKPLTKTLTDDILAELMPGLTSTTIVALRRADLRRGGSPESRAAAADFLRLKDASALTRRGGASAAADIARAKARLASHRASQEETRPLARPKSQDDVPTDRVEKTRKPTDSFTLSPEVARRVFETRAIEVVDPRTGDHIAFVRGLVFRDMADKVAKVQCFLSKGAYLTGDGGKVAFRIAGTVYRVRDGFYVTPKGAHQGEWSYLGYVEG